MLCKFAIQKTKILEIATIRLIKYIASTVTMKYRVVPFDFDKLLRFNGCNYSVKLFRHPKVSVPRQFCKIKIKQKLSD